MECGGGGELDELKASLPSEGGFLESEILKFSIIIGDNKL